MFHPLFAREFTPTSVSRLLSRLLGSGDKNTADTVASTALYSSILVGAILIIFATVFLRPILILLGATETIMPYALIYG